MPFLSSNGTVRWPDTLYGWMRKERNGSIDLGPGTRTPENALGLAEEVQQLRAENKRLGREIKRLREEVTIQSPLLRPA